MITYLFKNILNKFHRSQRGTALTEFVILLPIWITMFIGIVSLGKIGIDSTSVPLIAQQNLWTNALNATKAGPTDDLKAFFPVAGGGDAAAIAGGLNRGLGDTAEVVVDGFLIAGGHWGESHAHVVLFEQLSGIDNLTMDPDDIISQAESDYPKNVVNDGIKEISFSGGSAFSMIANFLSGSGLVAATAAGIRYGMATGDHEKTIQPIRGASFNAKSHFDVLLAPHPTKKQWPIGMARLLAEGEENYSVMMNFGESEWESSGGGGGGGLPGFELPESTNPADSKKPKNHDKDIKDAQEGANNPG